MVGGRVAPINRHDRCRARPLPHWRSGSASARKSPCAYLRASTDERDATREKDQLKAFSAERGLEVVSWYTENESGTKLARPELFRLLSDAHQGDILLVEQVDRLSRLTAADWEALKAQLAMKHIRVVALDLPTS
jgi:DNA invertase Pin-like site-specific DNA recombinase